MEYYLVQRNQLIEVHILQLVYRVHLFTIHTVLQVYRVHMMATSHRTSPRWSRWPLSLKKQKNNKKIKQNKSANKADNKRHAGRPSIGLNFLSLEFEI